MDNPRTFIYSAIEKYVAVGLSFLGMITLSRFLTPHEIGTYVVGFAIASLIQSLRDFGTSSYLVQTDPTEAAIRGAFGIALVTSAIAGFVTFASSHVLAQLYGNEGLSRVLRLCAALAILQPFGLPARALLRRKLDFRTLCLVNTTSGIIGLLATIAFALGGASYESAPLGALLGNATSIILLTFHAPRHVLIRPSLQNWKTITKFGGYATGATLLANAGVSAPEYIIGKILGFSEVGIYSRARGLLRPINNLLTQPFMPAVLPTLASAHREGANVKFIYLRLTSLYVVLVWPAFGLACLGMPDLVRLVLGPNWTQSIQIAQILCIGSIIWAPTALSGDLFIGTGHVKTAFRRELAIQPARVCVIYVAAHYSLSFVAASQIIVHGYSVVITQYLLFRTYGIHWCELVKAVSRSAGVAAASLGLPFALSLSGALGETHSIANLLILGTGGGASWIVAVYLFRHPVRKVVSTAINSRARIKPSSGGAKAK